MRFIMTVKTGDIAILINRQMIVGRVRGVDIGLRKKVMTIAWDI